MTIDDLEEGFEPIIESSKGGPKKEENQNPQLYLKAEYSGYFEGLVDIAELNGKPVFVLLEGEELTYKSEYRTNQAKTVKPPPINKMPWHNIPRFNQVQAYYNAIETTETATLDAELFDDLVTYHKGISELGNETHYQLIAAWVMHTYLLEHFEYSPILTFYAMPERGKSRTGKGIAYVAWRTLHVESLKPAYLFRLADSSMVSLFIDVTNVWDKAQKNGSDDLLLSRFEKGQKVPRVNRPDAGPFMDTDYFNIFGPTIIGTNESVSKILETRSIQINMPGTDKRFDNDVKPAVGLPFKERLVAFRARHLKTQLTNVPKLTNGRLGDILRPLHQIIRLVRPKIEPSFLNLVEEIKRDKTEERSETLEAQVLQAVLDLEKQVTAGTLPVMDITERLNDNLDKEGNRKFSPHKIGRLLSSMGFKKGKTAKGSSAIIWSDPTIKRLKTQFGYQQIPESPDTF